MVRLKTVVSTTISWLEASLLGTGYASIVHCDQEFSIGICIVGENSRPVVSSWSHSEQTTNRREAETTSAILALEPWSNAQCKQRKVV